MHYLRALAGQTAIYGLSSVVPRLLNYILVPLYTRVFLPEEYGVVTEMYAYLAFLLILLTWGLETGFFRFASKELEADSVYSTAFFTLLISSTIFIFTMFFSANGLANFLNYPGHEEYIKYLAIIIGLDAFCALPFAKLRLENRALTFSLLKIVGVSINVFLNFFFLVICPKSTSLINSQIFNPEIGVGYVFISNMISSILVFSILLFTRGTIPKFISFAKFKTLFLYSFPILIGGLGGVTNESFDRIFLKHLVNPETNPLYQLGIYGSNVKLAVLMVLFIQMYRYAAEPFFFANADKKESPAMYANMLKSFLVFSLLIFMGVGLFTDVFKYLVGTNFREGLNVVPILLLANLFYGVYFNLSIWFKLTNKTWYGIYYTFAGAILTLTLYLILIPRIGYYGAAIARLTCYLLMTYLCLQGAKKHFPIPYDLKRMSIYLFTSIFLFSIGYFLPFENLVISFVFRISLVFIFLYIVFYFEKLTINKLKEFFIR